MPTILSLCGAAIPETVQGTDFSRTILDGTPSGIEQAFLSLYLPSHEWRYDHGGREYRGLFDEQFTYVRALDGPWLLYDQLRDPYQLNNLVDDPAYEEQLHGLDDALTNRLQLLGDDFEPGPEIVRREGYALSANGDIAYEAGPLPEPYGE